MNETPASDYFTQDSALLRRRPGQPDEKVAEAATPGEAGYLAEILNRSVPAPGKGTIEVESATLAVFLPTIRMEGDRGCYSASRPEMFCEFPVRVERIAGDGLDKVTLPDGSMGSPGAVRLSADFVALAVEAFRAAMSHSARTWE